MGIHRDGSVGKDFLSPLFLDHVYREEDYGGQVISGNACIRTGETGLVVLRVYIQDEWLLREKRARYMMFVRCFAKGVFTVDVVSLVNISKHMDLTYKHLSLLGCFGDDVPSGSKARRRALYDVPFFLAGGRVSVLEEKLQFSGYSTVFYNSMLGFDCNNLAAFMATACSLPTMEHPEEDARKFFSNLSSFSEVYGGKADFYKELKALMGQGLVPPEPQQIGAFECMQAVDSTLTKKSAA